MNNTKTLLMSMPFASVNFPSLGISLLKAELTRAGFSCDIKYFNLDYAEQLGLDPYSVISVQAPFSALVGEWLFSHLVFEKTSSSAFKYLFEFLFKRYGGFFNLVQLHQILEVQATTKYFIDYCLESIDWNLYSIVGFTTTFSQTMASLALAKQLKEKHRHLSIVFGGADVEGEMGIEYHRQFPFIDFVCSGEGDHSLVELVRRISKKESTFNIPAVISRSENNETIVPKTMVWMVEDMDSLPYPDFQDFFAQRVALSSVCKGTRPTLVFETARGCWWGQKNHCTFCGLNGTSMGFRSKSQKRAYTELKYLASKFSNEVIVVDNILDLKYFDEFIPLLANDDFPFSMHYETKVNLRPWQIGMLADAGICKLQPGIESLCTEVLRLMNKGCTMLQNVQFLKLCAEQDIYVVWNFLYGFPNEKASSYSRMSHLIPLLHHLGPPTGVGRVRADRFSPFFDKPKDFGITSLEPEPSYQYIYDLPDNSIRKIAYHFMINYPGSTEVENYAKPCLDAIQIWLNSHSKSFLVYEEHSDGIVIEDNRACRKQENYYLEGLTGLIYRFCYQIRSVREILLEIDNNIEQEIVHHQLNFLVEQGLMLNEGNNFLSIALCRTRPTFEAPKNKKNNESI